MQRRHSHMNKQLPDPFAVEWLIPDFAAPASTQHGPGLDALEAADVKARRWVSNVIGPMEPGSEVHLREMCKMFRETFNPYRPSGLDWPKLDADALHRIVSLPIWDIAVQTEGRARLRMA